MPNSKEKATNKHIKLLSEDEICDIYSRPEFNDYERSLYFDFNHEELSLARSYRTLKTQVSFLLNLGYFKAKQRFFYPFNVADNMIDAEFLVEKYFDGKWLATESPASKSIQRQQENEVMHLLGYRAWSNDSRESVQDKITEILRYAPK